MPIKDNRITIAKADSNETVSGTPGWSDDGGGGFTVILDPSTGYDGNEASRSAIGAPASTSEVFVYYEPAAALDLSGSEVYFLMQVGLIGDLFPSVGMKMKLETSTGNDRIYEVANSTTWPATSVGSAWYLFVVDVDKTPNDDPFIVDTGTFNSASVARLGFQSRQSTMSKAENTWIDAIYYKAYADPALIIEGTNSGVPYGWDDAIDFCQANGIPIVTPGPGGSIVLAGPIQIGNTTPGHQHLFNDTNKTILWAEQPFANNENYKITIEGNAGSNTVIEAGVIAGAGVNRVGTQGWTIQAATTLANGSPNLSRWSLQANNLVSNTVIGGSSFSHFNRINAETANTYLISNFFIDGNKIIQGTTAGSTAAYLRNTILNANTTINIAALETIDLSGIQYSTFNFSSGAGQGGHAIVVNPGGPSTQSLTENDFVGYSQTVGNPNTAIDFANTAGAISVAVSGGSGNPTDSSGYKTDGVSVSFVNNVEVRVRNLLIDSEVRVFDTDTVEADGGYAQLAFVEDVDSGTPIGGTDASTGTDDLELPAGDPDRYFFKFKVPANSNLLLRIVKTTLTDGAYWLSDDITTNTGASGVDIQVAQRKDRVFANP